MTPPLVWIRGWQLPLELKHRAGKRPYEGEKSPEYKSPHLEATRMGRSSRMEGRAAKDHVCTPPSCVQSCHWLKLNLFLFVLAIWSNLWFDFSSTFFSLSSPTPYIFYLFYFFFFYLFFFFLMFDQLGTKGLTFILEQDFARMNNLASASAYG